MDYEDNYAHSGTALLIKEVAKLLGVESAARVFECVSGPDALDSGAWGAVLAADNSVAWLARRAGNFEAVLAPLEGTSMRNPDPAGSASLAGYARFADDNVPCVALTSTAAQPQTTAAKAPEGQTMRGRRAVMLPAGGSE